MIFFTKARKVSHRIKNWGSALSTGSRLPINSKFMDVWQRRHLLISNVRVVALTNAVAAKAGVPVGVATPTYIEKPAGVIGCCKPGSRLTDYENAPATALLHKLSDGRTVRCCCASGASEHAPCGLGGAAGAPAAPYTLATSSLSMRRSSRSITSNRQPFRVKVSPRAGRRRRWLMTRPATVS